MGINTRTMGRDSDGSAGARQRPASMPASQERPMSATRGSFTVMSTLSGRLMVRRLPKGTVNSSIPTPATGCAMMAVAPAKTPMAAIAHSGGKNHATPSAPSRPRITTNRQRCRATRWRA